MITDDLKKDAWSQQSNLPLVLIEISHDSLPQSILLVNNKVNIISNGDEYVGFPFNIVLPDSQDASPPVAKITIDNISREIGQAIALISTPPNLTLSVVRQETPDIIEAQFVGMVLTNVTYDALSVTADLQFEDLTKEPYPFLVFSPAIFKGIL